MTAAALARSTRFQLTGSLGTALRAAIAAWADATTDARSRRRADLLRDTVRALAAFFEFVGVPARPGDADRRQGMAGGARAARACTGDGVRDD